MFNGGAAPSVITGDTTTTSPTVRTWLLHDVLRSSAAERQTPPRRRVGCLVLHMLFFSFFSFTKQFVIS